MTIKRTSVFDNCWPEAHVDFRADDKMFRRCFGLAVGGVMLSVLGSVLLLGFAVLVVLRLLAFWGA
jgi:hypothetical protein